MAFHERRERHIQSSWGGFDVISPSQSSVLLSCAFAEADLLVTTLYMNTLLMHQRVVFPLPCSEVYTHAEIYGFAEMLPTIVVVVGVLPGCLGSIPVLFDYVHRLLTFRSHNATKSNRFLVNFNFANIFPRGRSIL